MRRFNRTTFFANIDLDPGTLQRDRTSVRQTYDAARAQAAHRLAIPGELDRLETAGVYMGQAISEGVSLAVGQLEARRRAMQYAEAAAVFLDDAQALAPMAGAPETDFWVGSVPHTLAWALGWRLWPAVRILDRHCGAEFAPRADQWAHDFVIRAQATLDVLNLLPRHETRCGAGPDRAVPALVDACRTGLVQLVDTMKTSVPDSRRVFQQFNAALVASY